MNSPVIIFSNDNFPVLMAFKLRFLFLLFVVEGRGRQAGGALRPNAARGASVFLRHLILAQARPGRAAPILLAVSSLQILR